mmetsp:Transcript_44950/g.88669  ORF Transcript_44950/g.88669 Transcript_44950/m.88669 type:complete len:197 (-) Transcript_44950:124-714(-)
MTHEGEVEQGRPQTNRERRDLLAYSTPETNNSSQNSTPPHQVLSAHRPWLCVCAERVTLSMGGKGGVSSRLMIVRMVKRRYLIGKGEDGSDSSVVGPKPAFFLDSLPRASFPSFVSSLDSTYLLSVPVRKERKSRRTDSHFANMGTDALPGRSLHSFFRPFFVCLFLDACRREGSWEGREGACMGGGPGHCAPLLS